MMDFGALTLLDWRDTYRQFQFVKDRIGGKSDEVFWIVGSDKEYAAYVEFGTYKMEAQPYLRPAVKAVVNNPDRYVADARSVEGYVKNIALAIEKLAKENAPVDTGELMNSIEAVRIK